MVRKPFVLVNRFAARQCGKGRGGQVVVEPPTHVLGVGLVDVYRHLQPDTTDACYTWWSNRGQAYAKNVGWRLDYHLATPAFAALARSEAIYKDERFSDHAPITVGYEFAL